MQKSSAVAVGDSDSDGDQDILQVPGGEFPGDVFRRAFFINPGSDNRWLVLQLQGVKTNGSVQRFKDLSLDRRYRAVEGRPLLPFR